MEGCFGAQFNEADKVACAKLKALCESMIITPEKNIELPVIGDRGKTLKLMAALNKIAQDPKCTNLRFLAQSQMHQLHQTNKDNPAMLLKFTKV